MTQVSFSGKGAWEKLVYSILIERILGRFCRGRRAARVQEVPYLTYGSSCFVAASIASLYISHTIIP